MKQLLLCLLLLGVGCPLSDARLEASSRDPLQYESLELEGLGEGDEDYEYSIDYNKTLADYEG